MNLSHSISRRTFLAGGAASVVALSAPAGVMRAAAAAVSPGKESLGAAHLRTFGCLVESVGRIPGAGVVPQQRDAAIDRYREWFDLQASVAQESMRGLLELIEASPSEGSFSSLSSSGRVAFLRSWWSGGSGGLRTDDDRRRHSAAAAAAALAAIPFDPGLGHNEEGKPALIAF